MIETIIKKVFGDPDAKKIKKYSGELKEVRAFAEKISDMSLEDIQRRTEEIKLGFSQLDFENPEHSIALKNGLTEIKIEAAALWIQACKCLYKTTHTLPDGKEIVWELLPYDVQIIGGFAIHDGHVAEMKTGEGKTLVATLPAYINALTGNSVHIVTVNDYLANRDAAEMGILYRALGLSVGVITHNQDKSIKKAQYSSDVVYATNNELGFDYLRDNMVVEYKNKAMSRKFFAIIDEVDSILIDEARTPLIISMPDAEPTSKYLTFSQMAKKLIKGTDYKIDEKGKNATLTETGITKLEQIIGVENIYISERYNDLHHIENALKASAVYLKDRDYIVVDDEVMIIDEHTGRALSGRRYSDGLHQALEAKEGVKIQQESKTLASITFQNYFRMYWKLAGMTGTAKTEEEEFYKVYGLETLVIPTNKPIIREDKADLLFKNETGKFAYVLRYIETLHKSGQPILVGTVSVEKSEYLSEKLSQKGIIHKVLNAKQHAQEAEVVAAAGQKGAITIATNMAGRGTDIKLGEGVRELGGLVILGTEKHETRRIDNQLRGRAGRQGDPGVTQFLISPNDDIMRIFGGDKLFGVFNSPMFASLPDDEPLTQSSMLTRRVTGVQKQVEGHHFDNRKHILEYDDVINKHREIIYKKRDTILTTKENPEAIENMVHDMLKNQISRIIFAEEEKKGSAGNNISLIKKVHTFLEKDIIDDILEKEDITLSHGENLSEYIIKRAVAELESIKSSFPNQEFYFEILSRILLQSIDRLWMNHIDTMSKLREQVAFMGYAQKQPLMVYKEKAYDIFQELMREIEIRVVKSLFSIKENMQIELKRIDDSKLEISTENADTMKNIQKSQKSFSNPLFVSPQNTNTLQGKHKIRV